MADTKVEDLVVNTELFGIYNPGHNHSFHNTWKLLLLQSCQHCQQAIYPFTAACVCLRCNAVGHRKCISKFDNCPYFTFEKPAVAEEGRTFTKNSSKLSNYEKDNHTQLTKNNFTHNNDPQDAVFDSIFELKLEQIIEKACMIPAVLGYIPQIKSSYCIWRSILRAVIIRQTTPISRIIPFFSMEDATGVIESTVKTCLADIEGFAGQVSLVCYYVFLSLSNFASVEMMLLHARECLDTIIDGLLCIIPEGITDDLRIFRAIVASVDKIVLSQQEGAFYEKIYQPLIKYSQGIQLAWPLASSAEQQQSTDQATAEHQAAEQDVVDPLSPSLQQQQPSSSQQQPTVDTAATVTAAASSSSIMIDASLLVKYDHYARAMSRKRAPKDKLKILVVLLQVIANPASCQGEDGRSSLAPDLDDIAVTAVTQPQLQQEQLEVAADRKGEDDGKEDVPADAAAILVNNNNNSSSQLEDSASSSSLLTFQLRPGLCSRPASEAAEEEQEGRSLPGTPPPLPPIVTAADQQQQQAAATAVDPDMNADKLLELLAHVILRQQQGGVGTGSGPICNWIAEYLYLSSPMVSNDAVDMLAAEGYALATLQQCMALLIVQQQSSQQQQQPSKG